MNEIEIPLLGKLKRNKVDWFCSEAVPVKVLRGLLCSFQLEGYPEDEHKEDYHQAIRNFLAADEAVLKAATPYVVKYWQDCHLHTDPGEPDYIEIKQPEDIWNYVQLDKEPLVTRRHYCDKKVYISLGCRCVWEQEHDLQIVFKEGIVVNKIGPYDGHLTQSDSYNNDELEDVIYY
jgi:hypothetical protein